MSRLPHARLLTSESVTEGHPDKLADSVSDAVLDDLLQQDPAARVACETSFGRGFCLVFGEVTTSGYADIQALARTVARDAGYTDPAFGLDADGMAVLNAIGVQSPDIAQGVDRGDPMLQGAGDQGMMYGYACEETPELMPLPISLAHRLTRRLAAVRKSGELPFLRPDGKAQVSVRYDEQGLPAGISALVVSAQHDDETPIETVRAALREAVIDPVVDPALLAAATDIHLNPTGRFVVGGPTGDAGLTGRKIIVDTYGGAARHGGGAFSGKDPSKVDRTGAYAARFAAKQIVWSGLAARAEVGLAYAIGVAAPVAVSVETFGSAYPFGPGKRIYRDDEIAEALTRAIDFRPGALVRDLGLLSVRYRPFASYGHMGREDLDAPWERTDRCEALREALPK